MENALVRQVTIEQAVEMIENAARAIAKTVGGILVTTVTMKCGKTVLLMDTSSEDGFVLIEA